MNQRKSRQTLLGTVIGNSMDKTVVVSVERTIQHRKYKKILKRTSKVYAHDSSNDCRIGDKVKVTSTRPLSKLKRWRVSEILERAQ
jgi:small subunit ribosomal protein S17